MQWLHILFYHYRKLHQISKRFKKYFHIQLTCWTVTEFILWLPAQIHFSQIQIDFRKSGQQTNTWNVILQIKSATFGADLKCKIDFYRCISVQMLWLLISDLKASFVSLTSWHTQQQRLVQREGSTSEQSINKLSALRLHIVIVRRTRWWIAISHVFL